MNPAVFDTALYHMAQATVSGHSPRNPLPTPQACKRCSDIDISYRMLSRRWEIWCGCGTTSGERKTLRAAVMNWNKENR